MSRKTILALILGLVLLTACQTASPSPTATALPPSPTQTATPTATNTPPPTPTQPPPTATFTPPLPTDTPLPPTNEPDCTNQALFVADVTVPDESVVEAGITFTKTWRVRNAGTCTWGPEYTFDYYSEDRLGFTAPISMPVTLPGETADVSITLTAPTREGYYQGYFVIKNPQGLIIAIGEDSRLWVTIQTKTDVQGVLTPTPSPTITPTSPPTATPTPTSPPTVTPTPTSTSPPTATPTPMPPPTATPTP